MTESSVDPQVVRRATVRLVPFLVLLYLVNYLDRVNVGFAALRMNADLGLSSAAYGLGAGLFFIGYFLFEVPSNLVLHRVGARFWIARIMITWGLVAGATAFVQGEVGFYVVRVLLGIAEAGFFPGVLLYLTYWFPRAQRARIVALTFLAVPLASVLGSPLSTLLLQHADGWFGLDDAWRVMFLVEGLPAVLLGGAVLSWLPSRPRTARWLTEAEKDDLERQLAAEATAEVGAEVPTRTALTDPRVLALSVVYFGIVFGLYVLAFFLPQVVAGLQDQFDVSFSVLQVGLVTAVPYVFASVAMVLWARHSDRTGERAWHVALPVFAGAGAIAIALYMRSPWLVMACITVCAVGVYAAIPVFWALPGRILSGVGAAAGIALINSFGNLSGFAGPYVTGWLEDWTGTYRAGMWVVAALMVAAGLIALRFRTPLSRGTGPR